MLPIGVLTAFAVVLSSGCSKTAGSAEPARNARPAEIAVWVYETFPPTDGRPPTRFLLSDEERRPIDPLLPDFSRAEDHVCKCGVSDFGFELHRAPGDRPYAEGHFFHGPDELVASQDGARGRLRGQTKLHAAFVQVLQRRGYRR
jgi:hypothetical protein